MSPARRPSPARPLTWTLAFVFVLTLLPAVAASAVGVNLSFTTSPPNPAKAGTNFPVTVHVQDNAAAPLSGVLVTLDIDPAHNPGGASLVCASGTSISTGAAGNASFTSCHIDKPGTGYQLRARASGATTVNSVSFDVEVGPAAGLVFTSYPADPSAPLLAPQPAVAVVDAGGNVITTDNRTITLSINRHAATFSCTGGLSRAAVNGVASFTGCTQTTLDTGYRLTAKANNLPQETGGMFAVAAGSATRLQFCWGTALPCATVAPPITGGGKFAVDPVVRIVDGAGNTITSDDSTQVSLSILSGTPTQGGPGTLACTGGLTERANNGVARFTGCSIDRAGTGYRLHAASPNVPALTPADSSAFNVTIGPASQLMFVLGPPTVATAGVPFPNAIQVAVTDEGGNLVVGQQAVVRLSLGANPGGASLSCANGLDVATVSGVATFNGCSVSAPGTGYRLSARTISTSPSANISAATSAAFNVLPAGAVVSLSTLPANGVITWGGTAVLSIHFSSGGAGRQAQVQVSRDKVTWNTIATLVSDGAGNASFGYRPSDNRYYRAVFAGAPDLPASVSPIVRIVVRQINLLRPTNLGAVKSVAVGTTIHFSSTVRPSRADLPTAHVQWVVYRLVGGRWTLVFTTTTAVDSRGVARLDVSFGSRSSYYVRSQAVPTSLNANSGWSRVERYNAG
jgi:hypothetical protein